MAREPQPLQDWHRLFGLLLTDFFDGTPFEVEVERDLSLQQQLLDVLIVRRRPGRLTARLPDGLEGLRAHNLVTFKSHHEALDPWALKELLAHSVAYRKLVSPSTSDLLPEEHFGLYAVTARFPQGLAGRVPWQAVGPGVYDCPWGTDVVRVVVAGELSQQPHNAPLHLISARPDLVGYGGRAYRPRSGRTSRLLRELFRGLEVEGLAVPYTMKDFDRDYFLKYFPQLTPQEKAEVVRRLSPGEQQQMVQALPPEQRQEMLQRLPPQERLAGLSPEQILAGLSDEQIRQYLDRRAARGDAPARKPRRKK